MTRTVKKISAHARVEIEEYTWHDNDSFFKTGLEKVEPVADGLRKTFEVKPDVKRRGWNGLYLEPHLTQTFDDIISLFLSYENI